MKVKLIATIILSVSLALQLPAQDADGEKGFNKRKLFTGGSVDVGFSSQYTRLGIAPHFGYSLNEYVDVAASMKVSYTSQRDVNLLDDRLRQMTYAPGAFVRVFPLRFLFVQAQYEHNFLTQTYKYPEQFNLPNEKDKLDINSLLVGGGLATSRQKGNNTYFYFSVMFDVAKTRISPYRDELNRTIPIVNAGVNIALFQD